MDNSGGGTAEAVLWLPTAQAPADAQIQTCPPKFLPGWILQPSPEKGAQPELSELPEG